VTCRSRLTDGALIPVARRKAFFEESHRPVDGTRAGADDHIVQLFNAEALPSYLPPVRQHDTAHRTPNTGGHTCFREVR
jgi:hypothetical protein